ncbi:hypothetical protein Xen7305DRAFT_00005550 [Xenococcus sp. PCC 7305]|uniref:DUF4278 domain-containing protein n=1 Tax=Xenococcus sp. PCC 7305 TaxID=102125 RepID=UPI0002ACC2B8|nr:DUF4278 domain-containing protein [Xenococcus sp. PCC 7305]ELS00854.1 hypothetical protein Xen7305DRAFT_00005550 [Xenococcus sp. PCC 7305]
MNLFFLIPLVAGIAANHIAKKASDEISYLMGSVTFFSFILSLVIAPWEVKLVVLAIALLSTYGFWRQPVGEDELASESKSSQESGQKQAEHDEQNDNSAGEELIGTYRGKTYHIHASRHQELGQQQVEQKDNSDGEELTGTYRGKTYHINDPRLPVQPHPEYKLKYRGVSVDKNKNQASQDKN